MPASNRSILLLIACTLGSPVGAQAPNTAPLLLRLPASTRAAALGNAWVAGRDEDVVFYNPAQLIGASRGGFNATFARYGSAAKFGSIAGTYAAGPMSLTLGWGVQFLNYSVRPDQAYPYTPEILTTRGTADAFSMLFTGGAAIVFKGFRVGAAGKYVTDRMSAAPAGGGPPSLRRDAFLGDIGLARNLLSGVAGLSVQNIRHKWDGDTRQPRVDLPLQASLGWSGTKPVGELDLGVAGQVTARKGWISPGAGIEAGYSWIEGYNVALRVGARRTETKAERPLALGASFSGDHLTLEYALQFFDGNRTANRMTIRWR